MWEGLHNLTLAAIVAALYVALTLLLAPISFGLLQLRIAEALTVLPVFGSAAVPGLILGCFLSNLLSPQNLGPVDLFGGTLATGLAAWLTCRCGRRYRVMRKKGLPGVHLWRFLCLLPPILVNALVVGIYLPYLLLEEQVTAGLVLASVLSLLASQSLVVYGLGLPLLLGLEKTPFDRIGE